MFAIACFALSLLLMIATGGNELMFKIREDIWTGPLGLACLLSVAMGRPLFFAVLELLLPSTIGFGRIPTRAVTVSHHWACQRLVVGRISLQRLDQGSLPGSRNSRSETPRGAAALPARDGVGQAARQ
ncbi:MAG: hypothetical protein ACRDRL_22170 [Sciscionella sp.]